MFISKFFTTTTLGGPTSTYTLANGVKVPVIAFGTWQIKPGEETYQAVMEALKAGYRHIDTAEAYQNEASVGQAIRDSGIPREDIFVTTKIFNHHTTYAGAKVAIQDSLSRLGLDYIDLYLIHWPNPVVTRPHFATRNKEVYRAIEDAYFAGKFRAIGVSNFRPHHLEPLLKEVRVKPMVNQLFVNPSDMQQSVVDFNETHDILTEAYSPFGTGKLFDVEFLQTLSQKYQKSIGQILLRWSLQHGYLPLPKSITPTRIRENIDIFDFALETKDIEHMDQLTGVTGYALDPDTKNF